MGSELASHRCDCRHLLRDKAAGFTLIELMVVVAVLSVLAVGAGLVASGGGRSADKNDVQRFQRLVEITRARAIQGRQKQGLFVTARGFQSASQTDDGWGKPTREVRWQGDVSLRLRTPRNGPRTPHILLMPDGRVSGFTLTFAPENDTRVVCRSDGTAGMSCG